eukprot:TRINITY_DN51645_c0_g1_i1.p1 TRINITY_DN51645_c0_g1~~TRINITY_DN51645_c0_g1_i1.p1  ORF type:complete len:707 (-),score=117.17 TRINITY_DN51645_c0_g1_i1:763-2682(-)
MTLASRTRSSSADALVALGDYVIAEMDEYHILWMYWIVFVSCLLLRAVAVCLWYRRRSDATNRKMAAMFTLFSTIQWGFYLPGYYVLHIEFTYRNWKPVAQVKPFTSLFREDGFVPMAECLENRTTEECAAEVNQKVICSEAYNSSVCSGWSWVGKVFDGTMEQCCVRSMFSLVAADEKIPYIEVSRTSAYDLLKWVSVLSIKWVIDDNPMAVVPPAGHAFVQSCTVRILDAVVFGGYMLNDIFMYPKYGIIYNPKADRGRAGATEVMPHRVLFIVWLTALWSVLIAPSIYTCCRPTEEEEAEKPKGFEDVLIDLTYAVRLLKSKEAHDLVDEAVCLQREEYVKQAKTESHSCPVLVDSEVLEFQQPQKSGSQRLYRKLTSSSSRRLTSYGQSSSPHPKLSLREGLAQPAAPGHYSVKFRDGGEPDEEDEVPLQRIKPLLEEGLPNRCGEGCCAGWLKCRRLCEDGPVERFENRAKLWYALVSLIFLEVPFFAYRVYIESQTIGATSFVVLLMARNVVWGFRDLLTIISCANEEATCLQARPLQALDHFISGSGLASVFVGPTGLLRIGADLTNSAVKDLMEVQQQELQLQRAWLIVERDRILAQTGETTSVGQYDKELLKVDERLEDIQRKFQMAHVS